MIGINSDYTITLPGLSSSGAYVNDATVSAVLTDRDTGEELYELDLDYVTDSNGDYQGTVPHATTAEFVEDQEITITITAVADGLQGVYVEHHIASYYPLN